MQSLNSRGARCILCFWLCLCSFAYSAAPQRTELELWNALQAKMSAGIKGNFNSTKYVAKISKTFLSEGDFEVSEKNGIVWQTTKPVKSSMNMSMDSLRTFFAGDYESLKSRFDIELSKNRGEDVLKLLPKERSVKRVVESIELRIVGDRLKGCFINWGNKDRVLYEFSVP